DPVQCRVAISLGRRPALPSAEMIIEAAGHFILGQRPDQQRTTAIALQFLVGLAEELLAKSKTLKCRQQVKFVNLSDIGASGAAGSAIGYVALNVPIEGEDEHDGAGSSDHAVPP